MSENRQPWSDPFSAWADWTRSATDFWQTSAKAWQGAMAACAEAARVSESRDTAAAAWRDLLSGAFSPEALHSLGSSPSFSEIAVEAARSLIDGFMRFQERMKTPDKEEGQGADPGPVNQQDIFRLWMEFHEKEIQPLLNIPQVGLTRFHQEKMNQLLGKFNLYQAAVGEFQYLLCRPMETSLKEMRDKLDEGRDGDMSGDLKQYYALWIKTLEGHYMQLFMSPEWNKALSRLVDEAATFRVSRNDIMADFMQFLPVPTHKEMDEVYKELYTLKKMVKKLLKESAQQEPNAK